MTTCGQQLYAHFYGDSNCTPIFMVQMTNVNKATERESFWIEKINCYAPLGLNEREEC